MTYQLFELKERVSIIEITIGVGVLHEGVVIVSSPSCVETGDEGITICEVVDELSSLLDGDMNLERSSTSLETRLEVTGADGDDTEFRDDLSWKVQLSGATMKT